MYWFRLCINYNNSTNINNAFLEPQPEHFIQYLKKIIKTTDWTKGLLIIGNKPDEYEDDKIKFYKDNYITVNSKNLIIKIKLF